MEFYTIGVYNSSYEKFFAKLIDNKIDTFCDIRQRRGVRGSEYTFVNSNRLQQKLSQLNIKYHHVLDLAPTSEIRELQKSADNIKGEQKRDRKQLGQVFKIAFKERILSKFSFDNFIATLQDGNSNRVVLFCVEEHPEACHRSIVSEKLEKLGYKIIHL